MNSLAGNQPCSNKYPLHQKATKTTAKLQEKYYENKVFFVGTHNGCRFVTKVNGTINRTRVSEGATTTGFTDLWK